MKRGIFVRINEEIWQKFREFVMSKHGKLYGALGEELEAALLFYLQNCTHTHFDIKLCMERMHSPQPIQYERDYTPHEYADGMHNHDPQPTPSPSLPSRIAGDIPKILEVMRGYVQPGGRLSERLLHTIIAKATLLTNDRSLKSRLYALIALGIVQPDGDSKVYIVRRTYFGNEVHGNVSGHAGQLPRRLRHQ